MFYLLVALGVILFIVFTIISPIIALLLVWMTKRSFKENWKRTSVIIVIPILTLFLLGFTTEESLSFIQKLGWVAAIIVTCLSPAIAFLFHSFKNTPFKKGWIQTNVYSLIFVLLVTAMILIDGSVVWGDMIQMFIGAFILGEILVFLVTLLLYWWKDEPFKGMWKMANFFLAIGLFLFYGIFTVIMVTEDQPAMDRVAEKYEERKDDLPEGNSIEKVVVDVYKTGNFTRINSGRKKRLTKEEDREYNASASIALKNYNEKPFEGTITVKALLNGEEIGKKEVDIEVPANTEQSHYYVSAQKLNVEKDTWDDVRFESSIEGDVEP